MSLYGGGTAGGADIYVRRLWSSARRKRLLLTKWFDQSFLSFFLCFFLSFWGGSTLNVCVRWFLSLPSLLLGRRNPHTSALSLYVTPDHETKMDGETISENRNCRNIWSRGLRVSRPLMLDAYVNRGLARTICEVNHGGCVAFNKKKVERMKERKRKGCFVSLHVSICTSPNPLISMSIIVRMRYFLSLITNHYIHTYIGI